MPVSIFVSFATTMSVLSRVFMTDICSHHQLLWETNLQTGLRIICQHLLSHDRPTPVLQLLQICQAFSSFVCDSAGLVFDLPYSLPSSLPTRSRGCAERVDVPKLLAHALKLQGMVFRGRLFRWNGIEKINIASVCTCDESMGVQDQTPSMQCRKEFELLGRSRITEVEIQTWNWISGVR
jgi:hypothetical protein